MHDSREKLTYLLVLLIILFFISTEFDVKFSAAIAQTGHQDNTTCTGCNYDDIDYPDGSIICANDKYIIRCIKCIWEDWGHCGENEYCISKGFYDVECKRKSDLCGDGFVSSDLGEVCDPGSPPNIPPAGFNPDYQICENCQNISRKLCTQIKGTGNCSNADDCRTDFVELDDGTIKAIAYKCIPNPIYPANNFTNCTCQTACDEVQNANNCSIGVCPEDSNSMSGCKAGNGTTACTCPHTPGVPIHTSPPRK